jgi:hypothetical protein
MYYANLIANKHQNRQQLKKILEDGISNDQATNCEKIDEVVDEFNEKDENYSGQSHKKGKKL